MSEGLRITLDLAGGEVREVEVRSGRPFGAARLFRGRRAEEAPALARRLFGICARAHGAAAEMAVAAAQGRAVDVEALEREVLAERAFEGLRAAAVGWPGMTPDGRAGAALRETAGRGLEALRRAAEVLGLYEPRTGTAFGRILADCRPREGADIGAAVIASEAKQSSGSGARPHAFDHGGAGLLRSARNDEEEDALDRLSPADDAAVATALLADPYGYAARPELPGRQPETGAYARVGGGLGRAEARLIDLRRTLAGGENPLASGSLTARAGFGAVETARGRLIHVVSCDEDGRILIYGMVAPTEWNFHPLGPFVATLRGARLGRAEDARAAALRLAALFDPCCAYEIAVRET